MLMELERRVRLTENKISIVETELFEARTKINILERFIFENIDMISCRVPNNGFQQFNSYSNFPTNGRGTYFSDAGDFAPTKMRTPRNTTTRGNGFKGKVGGFDEVNFENEMKNINNKTTEKMTNEGFNKDKTNLSELMDDAIKQFNEQCDKVSEDKAKKTKLISTGDLDGYKPVIVYVKEDLVDKISYRKISFNN